MASEAVHSSVASIGPGIGGLVEGHMDRTFRRVRHGCAERTPRFFRVMTGGGHPFANFALVSDARDADATREAVGALCVCGAPAAALLIGEVSAGVEGVLGECGFARHGVMPAMAVDIDRLAPTPAREGWRLERFAPGAREGEWVDAFAAGYEIPRVAAEVFSPSTLGAGGEGATVQFFGVVDDGAVVATSTLVLDDGVAGIYCVSTLPTARGRGLGAFVTAGALRAAREAGYRVGVLQSSDMGRGVYERLGFGSFGGVALYVRMVG